MEVAAKPAGSVEERQLSVQSICLYFNRSGDDGWNAHCDPSTQCQVATAVSPAILFCLGESPHTTKYDYVSGVDCGGEYCCHSDQPLAFKFECDNDATEFWGCGTLSGITTGSVVENLVTVAGFTTPTSTTGAAQTSLGTALPSAAISRPKTTSASPAMTSTSASPAMTPTSASPAEASVTGNAGHSSGLSAGSKAGSAVGAILAAIAIAIAIFLGYKGLDRKRQHRQHQSRTQSEGLLEMHAVADYKKDAEPHEPRADPRSSELPAESIPEGRFDGHGSRAELS